MYEDERVVYRNREAKDTLRKSRIRQLQCLADAFQQTGSDLPTVTRWQNQNKNSDHTQSLVFCCGLKSVLPQFICWSSNTWYIRMWPYMETKPSKKWLSSNEAIRVGSHPFSLKEEEMWTQRDTRDECTQRKDHARTQREGTMQANERGLSRTQTCQTYRSWTSSLQNCEKKNFSFVETMIFCYGSPSTNTVLFPQHYRFN